MIQARVRIWPPWPPMGLADLTVPPGKRLTSLAQNESAYPPSPLALSAAQSCDGSAVALIYPGSGLARCCCAAQSSNDPRDPIRRRILCGNGSMELIAAH